MSEERLKSIKENVEEQIKVCEKLGIVDEMVLEEKELLEEIEELREQVEHYRSVIENIGTGREIDW